MLDIRFAARRRHLPSRLSPLVVALSLSVAAWVAIGIAGPDQAQARSRGPSQHQYLGTWNYDQPDRASMTNIAVISCPAASTSCPPSPPLLVPQIGNIVFSRTAGGGIVGHTDQGCTWTFQVLAASLQLDPRSQYCFNHVIDSSYTITKWSVTLSGHRERETIQAISHQPTGDYEFRLVNGSRTKVVGHDWRQARSVFPGTWRYDAPDPQSRVNILVTRYAGPDGQVRVVQSPQRGLVTLTSGRQQTMTALTEDGCSWTLAARGNTAELEPALQTCQTPRGTVTVRFWAIASDGKHQASVVAGVDERGGRFLLSIGSLTKQ
jgi:hypothetical protein